MEEDLETQEIATSTTSVVLNGSVFNFSALSGEKNDFAPEKFETVSPDGLTMSVIPEGGSTGLQGLIVDTSRGLAVLSVGDGVGVGQVALNSIVGNLQNNTTLLSTSDLKIDQTAPHQLFEEQDVSSDSHVLHSTADPNELQLVTSSTSVTVGAVSTSANLEIDEPKKRRGGWPKGRKRKPEKESFAPKAPASAYVLFAIRRRPIVKSANPALSFVDITKLLGSEWSNMQSEQKQKYISLADADKQRYIRELKAYQQSEAYQNYLKKKKIKAEGDQHSSLDSSGTNDNSLYVTDLDSEELYCKVCDMYFSNQHNRKEHMFGKQHLQNMTSEFETELKKEKDEQHLAETEALNSDLSQDMYSATLLEQQESSDCLDVESFIHRFMQKNHDRETEILELRKSLENAIKQNLALVSKIQELKELESNLEQDLGTLTAYGASLNAQIDGLKMVPTLFGVINF